MKRYSLIMAGGSGTRFWPLSRQDIPKQLLNLSGNDTLINDTIKRFNPIIDYDNTFIVTNRKQADNLKNVILKEVPKQNILIEPMARNTAPCILYSALKIYKHFGDGIMCVFPSDHYITDDVKFRATLEETVRLVEETGSIATIGIKPSFPSTGYGYIKKGDNFKNAYLIDRFIEKPNLEKAIQYLESDDYYWNSGIFVWKVSVIIDTFKRFLPRIYKELIKLDEVYGKENELEITEKIYYSLDNISIDYGIMERIDDAVVVLANFKWNDMGSWDALGAIYPPDKEGNIIKAEHINIDTQKSIIYGDNKLIATIGLNNIVIVDTEDALMICDKTRTQDVKKVIDKLKELGREDLL